MFNSAHDAVLDPYEQLPDVQRSILLDILIRRKLVKLPMRPLVAIYSALAYSYIGGEPPSVVHFLVVRHGKLRAITPSVMHINGFASVVAVVVVTCSLNPARLNAQVTGNLKADLLLFGHAARQDGGAFATYSPMIQVGNDPTHASGVLLGLGGVGGWAAGFLAGGLAGIALSDSEATLLIGPLATASAGTAVGAPLGVHLTNMRRGNYGFSLLANATIQAAALGLFIRYNRADDPGLADRILLIGAPVVQLGTSIAIEINTSE